MCGGEKLLRKKYTKRQNIFDVNAIRREDMRRKRKVCPILANFLVNLVIPPSRSALYSITFCNNIDVRKFSYEHPNLTLLALVLLIQVCIPIPLGNLQVKEI